MKTSFAMALTWMAMALTLPLSADDVKWEMNPDSGQWSLAARSLALERAVTSVEVDGAWIELGHGEASPPVKVHDPLGDGERTEVKSTAKGVELSLVITLYKAGSRALVEASLRNVSDKPQVITEFRAFRGKMSTKDEAAQCRFFKNSGTQGTSGVFPIGTGIGQQSAYIGCLFDPAAKSSLGLGMVSYHRADATITTRATGEHELEVTGSAYFTRVPIQPGQTLSSEAYLLEWSPAPLEVLEHYADALAAIHQIKVSPNRSGFWNVWYAYTEEENTEENLFKCAEYQKRELLRWGIPCLSTGTWQRDNAFMEDRVKPALYPKGLKVVADELRERGIVPGFGGFFARVTETTPLFKEHPDYMVRGADGKPFMVNKISWGRCPFPHYLPDMTHPGMQQWYREYWQNFVKLGYHDQFWIDFEGGSSKGTRADPSFNAPFETDRLRLKIIREVVGADAQIGSYTSPTNRYLGLVDRVRMSSDVGLFGTSPKWPHIRDVARNMAAGWLYHNRVWINDPDPPMVGLHPDPARLEEARIRLLIVAMSGGFITLGERMPDMDTAQFRLLSTVMPPLGAAARPVDLFRHEMPEIQDLTVHADWDSWHVVSVINWDDPASAGAPKEVHADSEAIAGNKVPYAATHAFDGKLGNSLAAPGTCWSAASDKPAAHWISADFRAPRELSEIAIHWTTYKKFDPEVEWWTSARYSIQAWVDNGWKTVAEVNNEIPVAGASVTTHRFPTVRTTRLRILQPEGGGPPRRKNMMAIGEVEINPGAAGSRPIRVNFAELGLPAGEDYFVYEFWSQKVLGHLRDGITLALPPHTSKLLSIRPVPHNPWVVATDLHVSQGGVELREVKWDTSTSTLSGVAQRPGEKGNLVIYLPHEFEVKEAQLDGKSVPLPARDGEVLKLPVSFDGKPVRWDVSFTATGKKRLQSWEQKGQILAPGFAGTLSKYRISAPDAVKLPDGRLRLYFWGVEKKHYIYAAEASAADPYHWKLLKSEPMLGPDPTGKLRDVGASFPFVVPRSGAPWLMYYAMWGSWAKRGELSNRTGLAVSNDEGVSWEVLKEPLLPLGAAGEFDAGITGSVCVLQTAPEKYQMWYTAGERYQDIEGFHRGIVHIGHATSRDGIEWTKTPRPVLSPRLDAVTPFEAVVSKPCVLLIDGTYHMWMSVYSMSGKGYRIGYARSKDGVNWERFADEEILPLKLKGFETKTQFYPNVIEMGDELWMFYAANVPGGTGIGLATMPKSGLSPAPDKGR